MTDKRWKTIVKIGYVSVFLSIILGLGNCSCNCIKRQFAENVERQKIRDVKQEEIDSHYPKRGEMVELNGKKIVILKKLYWKTERTYQVRMEDGTITNVMGSEIKDKPIITGESK